MKTSQSGESAQMSEPRVGDFRASQIQRMDVGGTFDNRQRFVSDFLVGQVKCDREARVVLRQWHCLSTSRLNRLDQLLVGI